ncbi:MBL fold metallo-hydrolase [Caldisericum sp.]|uniref:MBL fold metallo-hydrolase n=1 Tax=Caldisericum sp. TaxID=2499687 RepID=UPI003D0BB561
MKMEIFVLGVGDAYSEKHNPTSFVINSSGNYTLVECPDRLRKILREFRDISKRSTDIKDINDVIITHLHGDHSNGLEAFGFWKRFIENKKPRVYSIKEVFEGIWENKLKAGMERIYTKNFWVKEVSFDFYFKPKILEFEKINEVNNLNIEVKKTKHNLPCFAIKVNGDLGYSSDTYFDEELIEFLSPCKMIIHETGPGIHTDYKELVKLPKPIKQKIYLAHLSDNFDYVNSELKILEEGKIYKFEARKF